MKRKIAWLVWPLVALVLVSDAHGSETNPKPTKLDLRIRALLSSASAIHISHRLSSSHRLPVDPNGRKVQKQYYVKVLRQDLRLKPFVDELYLSTKPVVTRGVRNGPHGVLTLDCMRAIPPQKDGVIGLLVWIGVDGSDGQINIAHANRLQTYNLHPVTIKRWLELLESNPRVGPELKVRIESKIEAPPVATTHS